MIEETEKLSPAAQTALKAPDFWPKLQRKYRIEINENKATAWERRLLRDDRLVLAANAILGTKAVEMNFFGGKSSVPQIVFDVYADQLLTDVNVASTLEEMCLFVMAEWELTLKTVAAGEYEV